MTDPITIGEFTITRSDADSVWIARSDGEGMQVNNEAFEEAIRHFYDDNF